jgi:hypothetical protein
MDVELLECLKWIKLLPSIGGPELILGLLNTMNPFGFSRRILISR